MESLENAKTRFSKLPTAPWKSGKSGEIPTFPPLRFLFPLPFETKTEHEELWAMEKWKSNGRIPTFPQPRRRRKEPESFNNELK